MGTRTPLVVLVACSWLLACGTPTPPPEPVFPPSTPKKTEPPPPPPAKEPEPEPTPPPDPTPAKEAEPEACHSGWVCVKIPLEGARKVEKRPHALLGDPKISQTWSQTADDTRVAKFDFVSGKIVEISLRQKPGKKREVVLRTATAAAPEKKTGEVVLDVHDGEDFNYVGFVAAEKDGAFLVDIRYMK